MIKTAVFVEGQTELVFVREFLLKVFEYQNIDVDCYTLFTDSKFILTEYPYPNPVAEFHFQIVNIGNDVSVLTRMRNRYLLLVNAGFQKIIGLRDMYSKQYRELAGNNRISLDINEKFRAGYLKQIENYGLMHFCFAIMEIEAWILGLCQCFERIESELTTQHIYKKLQYDLNGVDPETHFFHPANEIEKIFSLAGKNYNKSKGDISNILSRLGKDDFSYLYHENKCQSFNEFCDCLFPQNPF